MKKIIAAFIFIFILSSVFIADAGDKKELEINTESHEELLYRVREFVFSALDNLDTQFSVVVTGNALKEYTYEYLLKSKTDFETNLLNEYMRTPGKDYNSLILREYTISKTVWNSAFDKNTAVKLKLDYKIKWDETKSEKEFVKSFAASAVESLITENQSDYQKVKTLHDYVVDKYSYDTSADNEIHNPSQMIMEKQGVCSAYTGLLSMLLNEAGIENRIILINASAKNGSKTECHTWNLVKINSSWFHLDSTWDDPVTAAFLSTKSYDYFLVSDENISKDHIWDKTVYPSAEFDYSKESLSYVLATIPENIDESAAVSLNNAAEATVEGIKINLFYLVFKPFLWISVLVSAFLVFIFYRLSELLIR